MPQFWQQYHTWNRVAPSAGGASAAIEELEDRIDRLTLACEAMWVMLRERMGVTEEELVEKVNQIDLSDGQLDGRVRRSVVSCPKCNRTISPRFPRCIYCGQPVVHKPMSQ